MNFPAVTYITAPFGGSANKTKIYPTTVDASKDPKRPTRYLCADLGFTSLFSYNGQRNLTIEDMNAVLYQATLGAWMDFVGYPVLWNKEVCDAIGGYPKNAVVCIAAVTPGKNQVGRLREIRSLVDNNTADLTDVSLDSFEEGEYEGWVSNEDRNTHNFFPDYSSRTEIYTTTLSGSNRYGNLLDLDELINRSGNDKYSWLYIERSFSNYSSLPLSDKIKLPVVELSYAPSSTYVDEHGEPICLLSLGNLDGDNAGSMFARGDNSLLKESGYYLKLSTLPLIEPSEAPSGVDMTIKVYGINLIEDDNKT